MSSPSTTAVPSTDPRTGAVVETVGHESTPDEVDRVCRLAAAAAPALAALGRAGRARLLRAVADALAARGDDLVALADRESALGTPRLTGELARTCHQLRLFAEVLEEGSYLEAAIDRAGEGPLGPRPDLRRMLVPLGPVAVFGSSNFPFAYSVAGGDTASALAAGCPVVVKAHPAHPALTRACVAIVQEAARTAGAPEGVLGVVSGLQAGADLVGHPAVRAVGFTGSLRGGRALYDLASARPDPVPFYGELGSVNPLVVTPAAADERLAEIARGLVGSFTLGTGQYCTKPGLVLVPAGRVRELGALVQQELEGRTPGWLLSAGIRDAYLRGVERSSGRPGVEVLATGAAQETGFGVPTVLLATSVPALDPLLVEECFGPTTLVVGYADREELAAALDLVEGSLTATLHVGRGTDAWADDVVALLGPKAGRLVWNGFPTALAVGWATHHGGPWPASVPALHTSVGATAIRRFLRPMAWQDAPDAALPEELREGPCPVPRREDGRLLLPAGTAGTPA
ncbi:aldehyde dehydrogenase (NADP(+)) [Geodermatophilus sp. SYSU D01036]